LNRPLRVAVVDVSAILVGEVLRRDWEMATRRALGATEWQLARQLMAEGLLVALLSAGCGILLATSAMPIIAAMLPRVMSFEALSAVAVNWRAGGLAAIVAGVAGLLLAVAPLMQARLGSLLPALARAGHTRGSVGRVRACLLAGELGISVVVLVTAGLLARSFIHVLRTETGYDTSRVAKLSLYLQPGHVPDSKDRLRVLDAARRQALLAPGVVQASISDGLPPQTGVGFGRLEVPSLGLVSGPVYISETSIDEHFFSAIGVPVLRGRNFGPNDFTGSSQPVIVSRSLANSLSAAGEVLGLHFHWAAHAPWLSVIGVVPDVKNGPAVSGFGTLAVYLPLKMGTRQSAILVVRTHRRAENAIAAVERSLAENSPEVAVGTAEAASQVVADVQVQPRFATQVMAGLAVMVLLLTFSGLYGVFVTLALQRRREIGIKMALGATEAAIVKMMLREALGLLVAGIAAGLGIAMVASQLLRSLLYGVSPLDPPTFAVVSLALGIAAVGAITMGVRSAIKLRPMDALRTD
ncbi:MAG: FtsX-like permease family protein, partial [Acidobacteriota bacterium]|nr:FtsX-like permease family protein [Acidobacteriota bacterium]